MRTTIKGILLSTVIVSLSGPCLRKGLAAEVVSEAGAAAPLVGREQAKAEQE
ncbi:MAG: hypothetical protein QOG58_2905 [Caballeronia sp.]|nr:hypothetical protein [Caballeronia sp.]